MRLSSASTRPAMGVVRCFEGNRLAKDHLAQGYEAALPRNRCWRGLLPSAVETQDAADETGSLGAKKGVAA
jgi:hypothetical protein